VRKGDELLGVFAVQIPPEPLNELMHFTGETSFVGCDGLMRSQSRFTDDPTLLATRVENARCATD
jgi:methyl-accepting chemotaxis protein